MTGTVLPSWTWGSSSRLVIDATTPAGAPPFLAPVASEQLAQVQLPEPAVCSLYIQATINTRYPVDLVQAFTIHLFQGIGRVTVPRDITFQRQPAPNAPIEFTLPWVPLHALQVTVEATGQLLSDQPDAQIEVLSFFVLSPLTRMDHSPQKLDFGMATPGEADAMDDELLGNLEDESPSVQSIMQQEHVDGEGESVPLDVEGEEVEAAPAWLLDLVDALTLRLGRSPTKAELAKVVRRLRQRHGRRARRG